MSQQSAVYFFALTLIASICIIKGTIERPNKVVQSDFDLQRDENDVELRTGAEQEYKDGNERRDETEDFDTNSVGEDDWVDDDDDSDSKLNTEKDNDEDTDYDLGKDEGEEKEDGEEQGDKDEKEGEEDNDVKEKEDEEKDEEEDEEDDDNVNCNDSQNFLSEQKCSQSSDMCQMDVEPIGCFYDPVVRNRPLPILLRSHRDRGSHAFNNVLFNWKNGKASIKRLLCDCIEVARKRGMSYIGLQHYGECWSSKTAARDYNNQGSSRACVNGLYKPCKPGQFCVGKEHANYVYAINSLNPVPCKMSYETVGCYRDPVLIKNRPLPYLLESRRDKTSRVFFGKLINWKNYHTSLSDLVCSCAQRARAKGYTYFGIQYFGECWSGPGHISFNRHGTSSACKSAAFQQCKVKAGNRKCLCTGDQHSNYVYKLL